jgi:DNA polymerase alpha subunit B
MTLLLFSVWQVGFRTSLRGKMITLLQLGPFLDTSHPSIRTGKLAAQPVDLFGQRIGGPLTAFARHCPSTRILLITSVKDVLNPHFVFPQAPMPPEGLRLPSVRFLYLSPGHRS